MAVFNRAVFNAAVFNAAVAGPPPARDWTIVRDLRDRLEATGLFDGVFLGSFAETNNPPAYGRACWLSVHDFDEVDHDPDYSQRTLRVLAELRARADDPGVRADAIDRMIAIVQDAADRVSLAGATLPALTRGRRSRPRQAKHPESATDVIVEAPYLIDNAVGHDEG